MDDLNSGRQSGNAAGAGLPRHSFVEDPFFRHHDSDLFRDFANNGAHHRFGGSNPRLLEDDFFGGGGGFGNEPSFFRSSLPRRSPNSVFNERPMNMQRQQTTPQRSPTQMRRSPIPAEYSSQTFHPQQQQQYQSQPQPQRQSSSSGGYAGGYAQPSHNQAQGVPLQNNVYVIPVHHQQSPAAHSQHSPGGGKEFVEINNADPNSYTNGQLNPDKRRRFSSQQPADPAPNNKKVPVVKVEDYSNRQNESNVELPDSPSDERVQMAIPDQAIPLPPPASIADPCPKANNDSAQPPENREEANGRAQEQESVTRMDVDVARKMSTFVPIATCNEQLIDLLDDTELRVEQLREAASQLEQEKEHILDILNNVRLNAEILKLAQAEQDELDLTAERILKRCRAVDVVVNTPRSPEQAKALEDVNQLIQAAVNKMQDNLEATKDIVQRFLNACSPDEPDGAIDQRFQIKIVECTADDQKKIRHKLAQLIAQIDKAERTCQTPSS